MASSDSHELLIRGLARDLEPVRRLISPGRQLILWLACLAGIYALVELTCVPTPTVQRLAASLDNCAGPVSSMITALLGAAAALVLSRPDRSPSWVLLPAPAAALWIACGAISCFKQEAVTGHDLELWGSPHACVFIILGAAIPLSVLLMTLLRCGYSLRPDSTSVLCGLASAAAAATISNVVHPHDVDAFDLALHGLAIGVIVVSNRMLGRWFLTNQETTSWP
jgi:hypothetical protein